MRRSRTSGTVAAAGGAVRRRGRAADHASSRVWQGGKYQGGKLYQGGKPYQDSLLPGLLCPSSLLPVALSVASEAISLQKKKRSFFKHARDYI